MKTYYILIKGIVQGVGFRPFINNLAKRMGLKGWVKNSNKGVEIKLNCESEKGVRKFIFEVKKNAPLLSHIVSLDYQEVEFENFSDFKILTSEVVSGITFVLPDTAICDDCIKDIFDEKNRRYLYPFTNCTNCGPRYSIIKSIPYDRSNTTMVKFEMCENCYSEYIDSSNRRYHAQPNCCPACGPKVFYKNLQGIDAIKGAAEAINKGKILALKGLGGYHLIVDALNEVAVKKLRQYKQRNFKPFAVMVKNVEILEKMGIKKEIINYIDSVQAPILIIDFPDIDFVKWINPVGKKVGVMVAYTPLHKILMEFLNTDFIVATSGNFKNEPIVIDEKDAEDTLSFVDGGFLHHDRPIYNRVDDSVATVVNEKFYILRRARGFAPYPIMLTIENDDIVLGVGAFLKNTVSVGIKNNIFSSQYIGDLQGLKTQHFFDETVEKLCSLFNMKANVVIRDLHSDFYSSRYAEENFESVVAVQHHVAHMFAAMAENGLEDDVIGVVFDGVGIGCDKSVWGGEVFLLNQKKLSRYFHLEYMPQLGDLAAKKPYIMFIGYLFKMGLLDKYKDFLTNFVSEKEINFYETVFRNNLNIIMSSSVGRLFEAIGSIITEYRENEFEAHTAIALENITDESVFESYDFYFREDEICFDKIIDGVLSDLMKGESKGKISAKFHNSIVNIIVSCCKKIRLETGIENVVLSGGVFQNIFLLERTMNQLEKEKFNVFIHEKIPANDGGISAGQVYYYYLRDKINKDFELFW